jgi:hypothetical protein
MARNGQAVVLAGVFAIRAKLKSDIEGAGRRFTLISYLITWSRTETFVRSGLIVGAFM